MQPKTAKRRSAFRRANRTMPRRRIDIAAEAIDYKNPDLLKKFVTESGKILPRRVTGMPAHMHRKITREIKRSRSVLLMKSPVEDAVSVQASSLRLNVSKSWVTLSIGLDCLRASRNGCACPARTLQSAEI